MWIHPKSVLDTAPAHAEDLAMDRWQKDSAFVEWLVSVKYARRDDADRVVPSVSGGLVIYMWEAWQAGKAHGS